MIDRCADALDPFLVGFGQSRLSGNGGPLHDCGRNLVQNGSGF
ncbi:hypothetical protein WNY37_05195 [Henriciella sp. AS95]